MRTNEQTYLSKLGFIDSDRKSEVHDKICIRLCNDVIADRLCQMVRNKAIDMGLFVDSEEEDSWITEKKESRVYRYTDNKNNKIYDSDLKRFGIDEPNELVQYKTTRKTDTAKWDIISKKLSYFLGYKPVYFDVYFKIKLRAEQRFAVEFEKEIIKLDDNGKEVKRSKIEESERNRIIDASLVIEVKNKRQSVTDCIQQLNTYRKFILAGIRPEHLFDYWRPGDSYHRESIHMPFFILATAYDLSEDDQNVLKLNEIIWIHLPLLHDKHWN